MAICLIISTTVSNVFNLQIIYSHGIEQYIENIISVDEVPLQKVSKKNQDIYLQKDISLSVKYKKSLQKNKKFKYLGAIHKEKITWVSIQVIDQDSIVNGFLLAEGELEKGVFSSNLDNNYYKPIPKADYDNKIAKLKGFFYNEISTKFKVKRLVDSIKMQEVIDNDDYFVIVGLGSDKELFYTKKMNKTAIDIIYNNYLGDNLDAWMIQLDNNYSLENYGPYKRDVLYDALGNNYLIFIFFIILLVFIKRPSSKKNAKKAIRCIHCDSKKIVLLKVDDRFLGYLYQNLDGSPDGRMRNKNKKVVESKLNYICNECNEKFFLSHEENLSM